MARELTEAPPVAVLEAFGLTGQPERLRGGQGRAWRVADVVLKPNDLAHAEIEWRASLFDRLEADGFRVARPRRTTTGANTFDYWTAEDWLPGEHLPRRWVDVIRVGERFHAALRHEPRPRFLDTRQDPWAIGDRVAWEELPSRDFGDVPGLNKLVARRRPIDETGQLIHGDLTGNVLFDETLPPAVIDFSPYWRPAAFASAIVIADALVWEGADESLLAAVEQVDDFGQFLLRALIYRAVTHALFFPDAPPAGSAPDPFAPAVELAIASLR
jgi:uncharacterized protein (TIGR02569 family)